MCALTGPISDLDVPPLLLLELTDEWHDSGDPAKKAVALDVLDGKRWDIDSLAELILEEDPIR